MKNMHHRLVKMSILTASALEIAHQLDAGSLSSVQVVEACLDQIERHNRAGLGLHAIISVAPRESVLAQAQTLDDERRRGSGRSRLHGVPIVVKVPSYIGLKMYP
jgi:amidase